MKNKILLALFLLSLFLRVVSLFTSLVKWWDETVYANLGWDLVSNPFDYSFAKKWSDYTKDWPRAGYRAPLLPYTLALIYALTNSQILVDLFMPFVGSLSVIILYLLTDKLFNHRIAFYSSILLSFLPIHVFYSSKIMTDVYAVFFLLISVLSFWLGFEKG
ncbi:MAG: glycosyltransferase family 39 protein, partial [Candidatus Aenigmarchaeota archaeon]|nr:glycosyltransferase family 39 protein [Candidatus Aenigmarchaeota archaeon]